MRKRQKIRQGLILVSFFLFPATFYYCPPVLIIIPGLIFGRRSFCHHLCWMAPFMTIGRKISNTAKIPSLRLTAEKDKCIHCHSCTEQCPMSLPVESMAAADKMEHTECILCATCADTCKTEAIKLTFGKGM